MDSTVTIREVNQNTSGVFRRVRQGEELVVTHAGVPTARIIPFEARSTWEQMIMSGLVTPPKNRARRFMPSEIRMPGLDLDQVLEADRADCEPDGRGGAGEQPK